MVDTPEAGAANQAHGKEEKKKSTLDSVVDEILSVGKKALTIGALAAMPFVYAPFALAYVPRAAVTVAGFAAGQMVGNLARDEPATKGIIKQGMIGNVLSAPLAIGFTGLNNLETAVASSYGETAAKVAKVGTFWAVHQPVVSTMRTAMDYGVGNKFKKYWWSGVKNTFKAIGLLGAINVLLVSQLGLFAQMAYSATVSFVYRAYNSAKEEGGSFKNLYKNINPFSYVGAGTNVSSKLVRNTTKGLSEAIRGIYTSVTDLYKSSPKTAQPAAPGQSQPATAGGTH